MVNYQTSQYVLLNFILFLSCLGVFQYVREILQNSLPIDHPVEGAAPHTWGNKYAEEYS